MCDTYIVLGNATKSGNVIFGKNSDRLGSEAQLITYSPRLHHAKGESLRCTHITIPQVTETYEVNHIGCGEQRWVLMNAV